VSGTSLALSPLERRGLVTYLGRLVALDNRAAVRVQAGGGVLGVWGGPPFGVVSLRPVVLDEPLTVDVTVSAMRLRERLDDDGPVPLPDGVVGPSWAALLPPRSGWVAEAVVPVSAARSQVEVAVSGFRRRADLAPEQGPMRDSALTRIADELWEVPAVGSVPLRAVHAAERLDLLGPDGEVTSSVSGAWRRLGCPGGSVLVREGGVGSGLGSSFAGVDVLGLFGS
jgi:hypothetical protein